MRLSRRRVVMVGLVSAKVHAPEVVFQLLRAELESAGATVLGQMIQRRGVSRDRRPGGARRMDAPLSAVTFIGKGKANELAQLTATVGADLIVFLNPLSERQRKCLESVTGTAVQDATSLGLSSSLLRDGRLAAAD